MTTRIPAAASQSAVRQRLRGPVIVAFAALLLFALPSFAAIEGTVTNGTTGKPAAGAQIALLELAQGMNETSRTTTDAQGKFSFNVQTGSTPHLIRATHQGVNYFKMVPPGTSSASVQVFDSSQKVDGLAYVFETAFQTNAGVLQAVQFYVVRNSSNPPRTQAGGSGFEIALPETAKIDSADVQAPGGQPVQTAPNPKGKGRYSFDYPLRPGETTFRLMYSMPYSGEATFKPTLLYPVEQFAVITPQAMGFEPKHPTAFTSQPHQGGINIQLAHNAGPGSDLSFRISGSGQMPEPPAQEDQAAGMGGGNPGADGRPGGGLGNPINTPDPLTKYRIPILVAFGAMLVFGAFYIVTHRQPTAKSSGATGAEAVNANAPSGPQQTFTAPDRSTLLLEAMKEELFQLEVDRQQGRISSEEYVKAKAALDATLQRALARQSGTKSTAESA
ncbi:MAG TPA: carboxypeptidase-like regulatory domain-containing protein [Terriglobales bacterium]|nr:carboxypeptidase-like regulatory domain-containing protein [Terriglobales bacterium]